MSQCGNSQVAAAVVNGVGLLRLGLRFRGALFVEWVLQAAAAAALQWAAERVMTARHDRWRLRYAMPPTATQVRHFHGWLFALDVATLLYVQVMLAVFIVTVEHKEFSVSSVGYLAVFGGLTGYLWTVTQRRWHSL
jgi:hypothetical protein